MKRQQAMEEEDRKLKLKELTLNSLGWSSKASKRNENRLKSMKMYEKNHKRSMTS